jgi:hypothetical protein
MRTLSIKTLDVKSVIYCSQMRRIVKLCQINCSSGLKWSVLKTFTWIFAATILLPAVLYSQRLSDLRTAVPLPAGDTLIIGFLGGWEPWDNENRGVRKLALKLRERSIPGLHVETLSNHKRAVALEFVRRALDSDGDGSISPRECNIRKVILYGQSFGGAAVVKFARELEALGVGVALTVQVDSVGLDDDVVPANVAAAANLYQSHRLTVRGQNEIRAADPLRTQILENTRFVYNKRDPDHAPDSWFRRRFGGGHAWMDADPAVWRRVEKLILSVVSSRRILSSGVQGIQ